MRLLIILVCAPQTIAALAVFLSPSVDLEAAPTVMRG
jgi:hypothetical protein